MKKLSLLLLSGFLIALLTGCSNSDSTEEAVWRPFLIQGSENCLQCHTGTGDAPVGELCLFESTRQCLECHPAGGEEALSYGDCLDCHTKDNLSVDERCLLASIEDCLACHSEMRDGAATDYENCLGCHTGGPYPKTDTMCTTDDKGCLNCHSDMSVILTNPDMATTADCVQCHE